MYSGPYPIIQVHTNSTVTTKCGPIHENILHANLAHLDFHFLRTGRVTSISSIDPYLQIFLGVVG